MGCSVVANQCVIIVQIGLAVEVINDAIVFPLITVTWIQLLKLLSRGSGGPTRQERDKVT